ncbi:hypothetical protein PCASD_14113 [Puccinia coronata f. sp. avenae]|uniref:Cyclin N-terminal domain-containing protein n=1 Tax=Puccinia coronata f. sp. avenae TaxID=200324 RepID=A0A2N5U770_9BASI|nr:hypothetical protein PCASD_14113 [Puccinia coronata f. sp. avenae]
MDSTTHFCPRGPSSSSSPQGQSTDSAIQRPPVLIPHSFAAPIRRVAHIRYTRAIRPSAPKQPSLRKIGTILALPGHPIEQLLKKPSPITTTTPLSLRLSCATTPTLRAICGPLSDLAADIVWERCYFPKPRSSFTAPPPAPCHQLFGGWPHPAGFQSGESPSSHMSRLGNPSSSCNCAGGPANNNTYGVIGAEAKARRFNRQYPSLVSPPQSDCSNSSAHSRKPSLGTTKMEVKPAFRRWTRQVLENTLLSPQVLILALYYIESVAGTDVFGDTTGKMSLLPYKMLLAALVVANKTLDDHSYRNSTFANVSSMTNAEVNAVEVALLKALKFDVVPTHEQWTHWLQEVITAGKRSGLLLPDMGAPRSPLSPLSGSSQYHHQPQQQHQHQHVHPEPRSPHSFEGYRLQSGSIFDEAPARDTAGFYWSDPRLNPPPALGVPSTSDALRRDSFVRPGTFRPELAPPAYNNHASLFPPRVLFSAYSAHH